ncbi:Lrp/AsnC family transcriptional regulator [Nonomuraea roseoviolacea subsp. roseoviolacea]|uniref:DNA-binding Lrp family transcriptional regulator n=1 Tax=Nonomuraea roseoviolacea subsp. carminata TaxID=160689 RepID=A0ABT1JSQ8_9ACTN|nr:Lrp/AsnC family transcriptional regulator [Nonomuraea roseoviolacea]MCP2344789.1 DNA-binding Lrp family transcriptional regulator [Nonomuraea roseoviolacea subsp. carminata]
MELDRLDRAIIAALVEDARQTYAEIGHHVGLSASAVKRRVDRLRETGVITGFSARVAPRALGWTTEAYVELFCQGKTKPSDIALAVAKFPEVVAAATITGEADALVHIRATDVRHVERVIERIAAQAFVVRTKSSIVLSRLVDEPPGASLDEVAGAGQVRETPPEAALR